MPDLPRLDLPEDLRYEEVAPTPHPHLTIKRRDNRGWMSERDQNWLIGDLSFEYMTATSCPRGPARSVFEPDAQRLLLRDPAAERSFAARLEEIGFHRRTATARAETLESCSPLNEGQVLLQEGWRRGQGNCTARRATPDRVTSGIDWFELHGGATFGDQQGAALRRCSRP